MQTRDGEPLELNVAQDERGPSPAEMPANGRGRASTLLGPAAAADGFAACCYTVALAKRLSDFFFQLHTHVLSAFFQFQIQITNVPSRSYPVEGTQLRQVTAHISEPW